MLTKVNVDELNFSSRDFYERSLMKLNLSLVFAAFAFMFLGFAAAAATRSAVYKIENGRGMFPVFFPRLSLILANFFFNIIGNDDGNAKSASGFGFAAFCHVLCFIVSSAASIYLSPYFCGTKSESSILSTPQNIDGYTDPTAPSRASNSAGGSSYAYPSSAASAEPLPYAGYPEEHSGLNKI
jgi:hypothetical protein